MVWEKIKENKLLKWSLITVAVFIFLFLVVFGSNLYVKNLAQGKVLPGVKLAQVELGGLTYDQAREVLTKRIDFINQRGFVYRSQYKDVVVYPNATSAEAADTYRPLIIWDVDKSLDQVFDWQDKKGILTLPEKIQSLWLGKKFPVVYQWDQDQHRTILADNLIGLLTPKKEASFTWEQDKIIISPQMAGQSFDYELAMSDTKNRIDNLANQDIELKVKIDEPKITTDKIKAWQDQILRSLNRGDLKLTWLESEITASNKVWRNWLELKLSGSDIYLGFNQEKVQDYLTRNKISEEIFKEVKDAKFEIIDGKVSEFVSSQDGQEVDLEQTVLALENWLKNQDLESVAISIKIVKSRLANTDVNDLGITEIIGIGESDFTGSPKNRIHNINVGAKTLDGLLIAPGEEFSLIKALGEIDGEHGYLQELVIKGNETKPEFGGGLCQIGTTTFRAALASGLPITERRNHSYRVVYYEPAGTDATIYDPAPDFKFLNDTGNYLLIKTRIEGTKIYFDFWGTKDGRQVNITKPQIYNIVAPPPEKIIKTTDLEPGKKKCTESAHAGADAKFDYTVKYPDKDEPVLVTFRSHYVPWQKVCLLGVTEEELLQENNTSTPPIVDTDETVTTTPPVIE